MANNSILFNAALSGVFGGINTSRSLVSAVGADYDVPRDNAVAFASLLDAQIAADVYNQQDADLLQSIVQQVVSGKGEAGLNLVSINAIVAAFGAVRSQLEAVDDYGAQVAWAIDPATGDDTNIGTPAFPLATMAEFNRRYSGVVTPPNVAATLQLVGDVVDSSLSLIGNRFSPGSSLTVSGTLTALGAGTVSSSAAIGTGWQVTTTGIDWTTIPVNSHIGFSTGQSAAIVEVVDANNVIVSGIAAPGVSVATLTITNGSTITASSRSQMWPFQIDAIGQSLLTAHQFIVQNVSFPAASASAGFGLNGGVGVQLFACNIGNQNSIRVNTFFNTRVCRYTLTATTALFPAAVCTSFCCVAAGTGAVVFSTNSGLTQHQNLMLTGCRLVVNNGFLLTTLAHIRNTAGPVLIGGNGMLSSIGIISGTVGNTGIGIDVTSGRFSYVGGAAKPTVTGASDTRVGGVARTYGQIPFTALQLDAIPPTLTTLTGNGASIVQE